MNGTKLKRTAQSNTPTAVKKSKTDIIKDIIIKDDDDIDFELSRLQSLVGIKPEKSPESKEDLENVKQQPAVTSTTKTLKKGNPSLTNQEDKELRRERGEMLLKLFKEVPWLADSASARQAEKNKERNAKWEEISKKINDAYGEKLEVLSMEKVKKLLTYYKKKDDGSYDNISFRKSAESSVLEEQDATSSSSGHSTNGSYDGEGDMEMDMDDMAGGMAIIEDPPEDQNKALQDFLASVAAGEVPAFDDDLLASLADEIPTTVGASESQFQLKKERHDFVVSLAEYYMDRMCFDSSSRFRRSAAVNAERHHMWIKITHKANDRFASSLGALGVEQAKKLFSNFKRRRRVKMENNGLNADGTAAAVTSTQSRDTNSIEPEDTNEMDESYDFGCGPVSNFNDLILGIDKSMEVETLKKELSSKDVEITKLKARITQQADDYRTRFNAMLDILRVALDKKTSDDLEILLS